MAAGNLPLARYTDPNGRAHLVLLRGRLVLDVGGSGPARVVCELASDEGTRQARALLHGAGGYLERARRSERPLCRELGCEDVRPSGSRERSTGDPQEPPLAA